MCPKSDPDAGDHGYFSAQPHGSQVREETSQEIWSAAGGIVISLPIPPSPPPPSLGSSPLLSLAEHTIEGQDGTVQSQQWLWNILTVPEWFTGETLRAGTTPPHPSPELGAQEVPDSLKSKTSAS